MNIYFCGYMGVGKSSVAKQLAMTLKQPIIDLDSYLEYKTGRSISHIFNEDGEEAFRELEYTTLQEIFKKENHIVALGGGSLSHHNLHQRVRKNGLLIYLEADSSFLFQRLKAEKDHRPLLSHLNDNEMHSFISQHLKDREAHYLNAQLRVNVQNKSLEEIVAFILEYLEMI